MPALSRRRRSGWFQYLDADSRRSTLYRRRRDSTSTVTLYRIHSVFELLKTDGNARLGELRLRKYRIPTPAFMPVGTLASVKSLQPSHLEEMGYGLILANTYHLMQRPGLEVISAHGGLRHFMAWKGCILTDSGGYQVFSLSRKRRIGEDGVRFRSNYNGDLIHLTPESVIDAQLVFDSDIMMPLDVCPAYPASLGEVKESLRLTQKWAQTSQRRHRARSESNHLYGIIQGGCFPQERRRSLDSLLELDLCGYAIGGLAVGEPKALRNEIIEVMTERMMVDRPRYLMGVGTPLDIVESVARGMDQFDCVIPTRHARNGQLYTSEGVLRMRNASHRRDTRAIDERCGCYLCQNFTRSYLHHLYRNKEISACSLGTVHNLTYYAQLMHSIRAAISAGSFHSFHRAFVAHYSEN